MIEDQVQPAATQKDSKSNWIWWLVGGGCLILICVAAISAGTVLYFSRQVANPLSPANGANAPLAGGSGVNTPVPEAHPQANRNSIGDPNAPVKLSEFLDFQCTYCQQYWQSTEPQIVAAYVKTGKVFYTARSAGNWVSGNIGKGSTESQDAAMAAYCAADQNKYWEMHDALFTNVLGEDAGSFTPQRLQAIAQSVQLDMSAFNSCFSGQKYLNQVNQDSQDAQAAGIQGTPFFVITYTVNGQTKTSQINGAEPYSAFQQAIDAALQGK